MPTVLQEFDISTQDSVSADAIQKFLRQLESSEQAFVRDFRRVVGDAETKLNVVYYEQPNLPTALPASTLRATVYDDSEAGDTEARKFLVAEGHHPVAYSRAWINKTDKRILLSRPGRQLVWQGKMSHFGGPDDHGVGEREGLALVTENNFAQYKNRVFLPSATGPLARSLDPKKYYLAIYWDYSKTPPKLIRASTFSVKNVVTGKVLPAIAVDMGPAPWTRRVADLSPGLAKDLGLETDDECIVTMTFPDGDDVERPAGPVAGMKALTTAEVIALFGSIEPFTDNSDGSINVKNPSYAANMQSVTIPQLAKLKGGPANGVIECHKLIAGKLQAAFAEIEASGKLAKVLTWDGCLVARHIMWDKDRGISLHTWGIAIDINAHWNPAGHSPAAPGAMGDVHDLVPIFGKHGFFWGGHFRDNVDGMHFQWGRTTVA